MKFQEKLFRSFFAIIFFLMNSHVSPAIAASAASFNGYNAENMTLSEGDWTLDRASLSGGAIQITESGGSATFVLDVSSIGTVIDMGHLEIDFSAQASATAEDLSSEIDSASITIGFSPSSDSPSSSVVLTRDNGSAGAQTLSSNASIPTGTRYIFVIAQGSSLTDPITVAFSAFSLTIPTQKPSLQYEVSPSGWTAGDVTVYLTASDPDSGIEGIYDSSDARVSASGSYQFTTSTNGSWRFYAKDYEGAVSDSVVAEVTGIDRTAPAMPELSVDTDEWSASPVGFSVTESATDEGPSPVHLQYRVNGGDWQNVTGSDTVSEEGVSTLEARALDGAGNASEVTAAATVRYDGLAPDLSLESVPHLTPAGSATVEVTVSDADSGVSTVKYASGSQEVTYFETGGGEVLSGSSFETSGGGTYSVYASDAVGNSTVAQITVNTYPSIDTIPDQTMDEDIPLDIYVSVSDIETPAASLTVLASPTDTGLIQPIETTNEEGLVKIPLLSVENQNGSTSVSVEVTDGEGLTASRSFLVTVNPVDDVPTGSVDSYTLDEDTTLTVSAALGVLSNDSDVDGDSLSAILVESTSNGTLLLNPDGSFEYVPNSDFNGTDQFSYKVSDSNSESAPITVTLTINAVDDSPLAGDDTYSVDEDETLTVPAETGLLANDSDSDSDTITAALLVGPTHGSLTLNADGSFTYAPDPDYFGADSFTYHTGDGNSFSEEAVVSISVNGVEDAPFASADGYETSEDTPLSVDAAEGVLANDSDLDGDSLIALLNTTTAHGTLDLSADGSFSYSPAQDFNGIDSFSYYAFDGTAASEAVTVQITVSGVNDAPLAENDDYSVDEDGTLTVTAPGVLANDSDVEEDALTVTLVTGTANGELALNADGSFTYSPNADFNGSDGFTYIANDGSNDSNVATVTITVNAVNDTPVGSPESYSTDEDVPLEVSVTSGVLANDTDIDGDELLAEIIDLPQHGTLLLALDGSFVYSPYLNYNGSDSFTYQPYDGQLYGATITVSLSIGAVNDAPVAANDSYEFDEDQTPDLDVLANDTDVEEDPLLPVVVAAPTHGSAVVNPDGTIKYTPDANYNGSDSFTYKANDGASDSLPATVTLLIDAVNDAPQSVADGYSTDEDTLLTVPPAGVLANDTDVESDPLTAILVSDVSHGTLSFNEDGSFSYSPAANFNGTDSFTYKSNDGSLDGNEITVTLTVNAVNDVPVASADAYSTNEDVPLNVAIADGVLKNDTDVEGSTLSAILVTSTSHGTLSFETDGSFLYSPNANYNGSDSFTYKPYDGTDQGQPVTVTLTVNSVNDTPVASNDTVTLNEDTLTTIDVLSNDSDIDQTTNPGAEHLTLISVSDPPHGTASIVSNKIEYLPDSNYNGTDSFTYTVSDDGGLTANATVSLTIRPVNDYPVFTSLNATYTTDEDVTLNITFNISDVETPIESLMLQVTSGDTTKVANSDLTLGGLGDADSTTTLKIKPTANKNGDVVITLRLGDGFLVTTQSFTLHITPVNDAPTVKNDLYNFTEDTPITIDMDNLLANDSDIDGDTLSFVSFSAPSLQGTLTLLDEAENTYTFTPTANFDGTTTFTYTMTDGTVTRSGTVSLQAIPVNDAPTLVMDAENPGESDEDVPLTLAFTIHDWETAASLLSVQAGSDDTNLVAPANLDINCNSSGACTMLVTPSADQNGTVTLTVSVSDGVFLVPVEVPLTFNPVEDAPTAVNDVYSVHENSTIQFTPLDNDFDPDSGDTISLDSVNADGSIGTLNHTAAGVFTYTPPTGFTGEKTFEYTITDGSDTATATVTLNVSDLNNPPVISPILHQYILEDESLSALAFTITDQEGDALTVTGSSANTDLVLSDSSSIVVNHVSGNEYTVSVHPVANAFGEVVITLHASDGENDSTRSFCMTIYPVNDIPTAVDDEITTDEDVAVSFNPLVNDLDVESTPDQMAVVEMSAPINGVLSLSGKTYTYTPFPDYNGSETLTYIMSDGAARDEGTITITITPVNDPPDAEDNWVTLANTLGASVTIHPLNNDSSGDSGDTISLIDPVVSGPSYGTAVVDSANGTIVYTRTATPADSHDSFVYQIIDSGGLTDTATVYIADGWSASMHANNAWLDLYEDDPESPVSLGISDGKGDGWTLQVLTTPTLGTIRYDSANGNTVYYTPNPNANGSETLTYRITSATDESLTATASIYIRIYPVNDLPTITDVEDITIPEDSVTDPISVTISDVDDPVDDLIFNVYSNNQQLVLNRDFSVSRSTGSGDITFTITPIPNRFGTAQIEMLVSDSIGFTTKTFTLNVTSVNDPPTAEDYTTSVLEDASVDFTLITPLSDADGDALTLTVLSGPDHGEAIVHADNSVTYTPDANFSGTDSFVYQLDDGNVGGTDTATVTISVIEVDDGPVITNLTYLHTTLEDTPVVVPFTVTDLDTPLADLEITITSSNGSLFPTSSYVLSGDGQDKSLTLTPSANLSGEATFTVRVSDGTLYDQQAFKVVVDPVNDLPTAVPDTAETNEDTAVLIGVTANDHDVEDVTLTVASMTTPGHGTLVNNRNGTITYTPAKDWFGVDSFTYTVVDKNNGSATATVTVTVDPVNDAPVAAVDRITIVEDSSVNISPLNNDSDVENDPISLVSYTEPVHGTLLDNGDETFYYTPDPDYYGTDTFTYTITDGLLNSTGTVNITITSVNDAPRLSTPADLPWTMDEDTPTSFPIHIYDPETPADNLVIRITSSDQNIIPDTSIDLNGSGSDKTLLLTPKLNKFGTLEIQIEATDGYLTTTEVFPVLVRSVNDIPTISDVKDQVTDEDVPTAAIPFIVTDIETTAGDLTIEVSSSNDTLIPVENVTIVNGGGTSRTVQVTPADNLNGVSTITLTVHDADGGTSSDTFKVTVNPVNDPPLAVNDATSVDEDSSVEIFVLANDEDVDLANEGDNLTIVSVAGVDNGEVSIAENYKSLTFTPAANWNGEETFTYTIQDSSEVQSTATVTVTVDQVNDDPVAWADQATMSEDADPITILVLDNDTDLDLEPSLNHPVTEELSVSAVTQPAHGTASISPDGKSVIYEPDDNWFGEADTFTYTVSDKAGATDVGNVTVEVTAENDPPTISDIPDQVINEDTNTGVIAFTVADVDDDVSLENFTVTAVSANTTILPTVTLGGSGNDRTILVAPAANKNTYLSGPITITVTATDPHGEFAQDTFTVTVNKLNDPPVAPTLTYNNVNEDSSVTISPISSSVDVDLSNEGDTVLIDSTADVDNGTVTIATNKLSMVFTPTHDWNGVEDFTYTLIDAAGATSTAHVTVTVKQKNDAPIANTDSLTVAEDSGLSNILVLSNDSDVDFDTNLNHPVTETWSVTAVTQPVGGTAAIASDHQSVNFTPNANWNGTTSFTYTVTDKAGSPATATVNVQVTALNDAPQAVNDTDSMGEDGGTKTIYVLSNDVDFDLYTTLNHPVTDSLNIVAVTQPSSGTTAISLDGQSLTYTPLDNWNGSVSFTYTIQDSLGETATATVNFTVAPVDDAPMAQDDSATVNEDSGANTIWVLANDSDIDFETDLNHPVTESWSITAVTQPVSGGTASISTDRLSVKFTPAMNWNGSTSFTYTVRDSGGLSATKTVYVTVTPLNDPPVAVDDTADMSEDGSTITINVLTNDSDVDFSPGLNHPVSESWSVTAVTVPDHGSAAVAEGAMAVTYTPPANWNGTATFTYYVTDASGASDTAEVYVDVAGVDDAPTLSTIDDQIINEDSSTGAIDFTIDDIDTDLADLEVFAETDNGVVIPGANISIQATEVPGAYQITVTPAANKNTFGVSPVLITVTVREKDTPELKNTTAFYVTVLPLNDPPVALEDHIDVNEDGSVIIHPLVNDSDVDISNEGDSISIYSAGAASHGTVEVTDASTLTYTPDPDWNGDDSFTYTIIDGSNASDTATIYMNVIQQNDAPLAVDDSQTVAEDSEATQIDVLANDSDTDFDPNMNKVVSESWSISAITTPGSGTVEISEDGLSVLYTPQSDWNGITTFTYTVKDKAGAESMATVTMTVTQVNDDPLAIADDFSVEEDSSANTLDVLANDRDVDFNTDLNHPVTESWQIVSLEQPAHGSVSILPGSLAVSYTPPANWNGETSFVYTVRDAAGVDSTVTATVTVNPVNDAPQAVDDSTSVDEDGSVEIFVLENDSDIDLLPALNEPVSDSWSITAVTDPESGTVDITGSGQTLTYTPIANWNGTVHFTYTVTDSGSASATANVTVTVNPVNDAPQVTDDSVTLNEDDPQLTIDVLANDSDVDFNPALNNPMSESWQIVAVTQPAHGSAAIATDKLSVSYTTQPDWNGLTSFTYTVKDAQGASATGTVNITVNPQEDSPLAVADTGSVNEDATVDLSLLENDVDPDLTWVGDHLTITSVDDFANCTVEIVSEGQQVRVSPATDFNGTATFTYTIEDLDGNSSTALVTVTVNPVNDAPLAVDDTTEGDEDESLSIDPLANDFDVDYDTALNHPVTDSWHISEVGTPTNGSVIIDSGAQTLTYVPDGDWNGTDEFTYTVMDSGGLTSTASIAVTIHPVNDAPAIEDVPDQTIDEDSSTGTISFAVSDIDTDVDDLVVSAATANGTIVPLDNIVVAGSGDTRTVTVTPTVDYNTFGILPVAITLTVSDGELTAQDVFHLTIRPVNDAPVAVDDVATGKEDTVLTLDLLANDTDIDFDHEGDDLTIVSFTGLKNASATISADGKTLLLRPSADWYGVTTFTYTIQDSQGAESSAAVTVTITDVPDDIRWITEASFYIITPTAGERYKDGQTIHVTWTSAGENMIYTLQFFDGSEWKTLAENLTATTYDHYLDHTYLHTASAQYRVLANWGSRDYLMDESDFFVIDNHAPINVQVDVVTQMGLQYTSGKWTNGPVTLRINGGWDLTGTEYEIEIDEQMSDVQQGLYNALIETAGVHHVRVITCDPLKNEAVIAEYEIRIDREAPLVPEVKAEPANDQGGTRVTFAFKEDPGGSGNDQLVKKDGTAQDASTGSLVWENVADGQYPLSLSDHAGNVTTFVVRIANGNPVISDIVETNSSENSSTSSSNDSSVNGSGEPVSGPKGGGFALPAGAELPLGILGGLGLLILLFPPNLKIVYTVTGSDGKPRQKTRRRWVLPPNNKKMKVKVEDAQQYEVIMSRILTRSMRGGSLTIEPKNKQPLQTKADVPDNAKGKFKANY